MRKLISRSMRKLGSATAHHGESVVSERAVDRAEERAATIGSLLRSLSGAVIYGVAAIMILETFGIGVAYSADLQEAMAVLGRAAKQLANEPEWEEKVTHAPDVQGVEELGEDGVNIRIVVWVDAGERRRFERQLRLKLKEALDQSEIEMPNRQLDVWLRGQPQPA